MKKMKIMLGMAVMAGCFFCCHIYSMAGEISMSESIQEEDTEGEYTMIRIHAEDDSSGPLMYAIDSDAPEAFGTSSEFTVKKGSEHTVYVKDPAGNISAQVYRVPEDIPMDIEVNIGYSDTSSSAMLTDEERQAVETGGGTVAERVITDGSSDAERVFYTVTTKDEHVFYLMIDKNRGEDNVYLLDQVTDTDLYDLAKSTGSKEEETSSIFSADAGNPLAESPAYESERKKQGGSDWLLYAILILLGAATFYYYKIYKPKQKKLDNVSDALDLDEFGPDEEDGENEVMDFSVSQEEKDALLDQIMHSNDLEEELNYDPDSDPDISGDGEDTIEELELPEEEEDE